MRPAFGATLLAELAELASRNWSLYPVLSYRATLMACRKDGKTGIGTLEDVGSIAWHRCTILAMTEVGWKKPVR